MYNTWIKSMMTLFAEPFIISKIFRGIFANILVLEKT